MVLWIIFAALTGIVLTAILWPVMRARPDEAERTAYDAAIYRDQLREIETDLASGLIGPAEAEAAKTEISRRLLTAADAEGKAASDAARARSPMLALGCVLVCIPVLGLALYLSVGSPALPDRPLAARLEAAHGGQKIAALVAKVEARLREHPEDGKGWDVIAPVYMKHRRYQDAAEAYARAIRLLGESTRRLAGYAEAQILANNGIVSETARKAYEKVLAADPARLKPRFWLAMAMEQDGRLGDAAAAWREMLKRGGKDAPWRKVVERQLQGVEAKLTPGGAAPAVTAQAESAPERGPSAADVEAAQRMTREERAAMINQMVEGLAERLKQDGKDLGGWLRLVRAYKVLGKRDAALGALADARRNFDGNGEALSQLDALAESLGL